MQKIVFVLCEGPHDVAFLYRILKTVGFKNYSETLKDFPSPVNEFLLHAVQGMAVDEMNLAEIRQRPLPSDVLQKDNTLFLFYPIGSDSKKTVRRDIVTKLITLIPQDVDAINPVQDISLAVAYFFDADQQGVASRLAQIADEIQEVGSETFTIPPFRENGCVHDVNGFQFGIYVFSESNGYGKLEDIALPLIQRENESIFNRAEDFLRLKDDERLRRLKIREKAGVLVETRTSRAEPFDRQKSLIGVVGQLQNSGASNVVTIKHADYLTLRKIHDDERCQTIVTFFQKMFE